MSRKQCAAACAAQEQANGKAKRLYHDIGLRLVKLLDVLLVTLPFAACWFFFYSHRVLMTPSPLRSAAIITLFVALYLFFVHVYDGLLLSVVRIGELFFSQLLGILMADAFMFVTLWLMSGSFPVMLPALAALCGQLVMSLLWCRYANAWYFRHFSGQKAAVIYDTRKDANTLFGRYGLNNKFDIRTTCTVEECLSGDMRVLDGLDAVFLFGVHSHERNIILKHCVACGICAYLIPRIGDVIMSGAKRMHMFHLPILRVGRYRPSPEFLVIKRTFDILSSAAVLLLTSPLLLAVALAVKLQDGGPVFYRQTRLTKDGREFKILKFRSMRVDAEKDGVARLSSGENDDRITRVGRFIRACRLDELPQLFNILLGSMSVVGPRPERPELARQYEQDIPEFSLRLQAKAGLTGYAQVYGKYNTDPYDKLQMDLMYIANPSLIEDLKIIFATIRILFDKESTEGIRKDDAAEKEQVSAGKGIIS